MCEAINSTAIREAIEGGATSLQAVGEACGAGTVCGKCKSTIRVLIAEHERASSTR